MAEILAFIQKGFNQHLLMVCTLICIFSPSIAITATSQNKIELINVMQRLNYGTCTIFKSFIYQSLSTPTSI